MKVYKVRVSNDKDLFFKELMENLGIELQEFTAASYARIADKEEKKVSPVRQMSENERKKAAKVREESLQDVISKIEQMRNKK